MDDGDDNDTEDGEIYHDDMIEVVRNNAVEDEKDLRMKMLLLIVKDVDHVECVFCQNCHT